MSWIPIVLGPPIVPDPYCPGSPIVPDPSCPGSPHCLGSLLSWVPIVPYCNAIILCSKSVLEIYTSSRILYKNICIYTQDIYMFNIYTCPPYFSYPKYIHVHYIYISNIHTVHIQYTYSERIQSS